MRSVKKFWKIFAFLCLFSGFAIFISCKNDVDDNQTVENSGTSGTSSSSGTSSGSTDTSGTTDSSGGTTDSSGSTSGGSGSTSGGSTSESSGSTSESGGSSTGTDSGSTSTGGSSSESSGSSSTSGSSSESESSGIDWSSIAWAGNGSGDASLTDKFKFYAVDGEGSLVNIQYPSFATAAGLYVTFSSAPSASDISLDSSAYDIQGAGVIFHCSAFTAKETIFTVTLGGTSYKLAVYYADGTSSGSTDTSGGTTSGSGSTSGGSSTGTDSGSTSTGGSSSSGESSSLTKTIGGETYTLYWNDEFTESDADGTPLSSKWGYDVGIGYSENSDGTNPNNGYWGNGELQWYSNKDPDNTYVSDGTLKIKAIKESSNGQSYTSGRLVTRNISGAQFKYGYIEMSAKIPNDAGVWPAFWMLDNDIYASTPETWPGSGEIDIMESSVNLWGSDKVYGTLHCQAGYGGNPVFTQGTSLSFSDGEFHTYAVDWDDDHIDWYYDDTKVFTYEPGNYENDAWPFCDDFYIILNLAVGGNLGGTVPSDFVSSTMEVDYVRVWKKDSGYTDKSGAVQDTNAPSSTLTKSIPEDAVVIFDSSASSSKITSSATWNGGWASSDYELADGKTVKQINFSSLNGANACGGWNISEYNFSANTKLYMSVYASQNFSVKPVKPEVESLQSVSNAGTYEWLTVEVDLGSADTLKQIGFISTVEQKIYVDHVYLAE